MPSYPGLKFSSSCALIRAVCRLLLVYGLLVFCSGLFYRGTQAMRLPRHPSVALEEDFILPRDIVKRGRYMGAEAMCKYSPMNCNEKKKRFSVNWQMEEDGDTLGEVPDFEPSRTIIQTYPLIVRMLLSDQEDDYAPYRFSAYDVRK